MTLHLRKHAPGPRALAQLEGVGPGRASASEPRVRNCLAIRTAPVRRVARLAASDRIFALPPTGPRSEIAYRPDTLVGDRDSCMRMLQHD